jgi:hypothetical protein
MPLGFSLVGIWQARGKWATRRIVADALCEHRDPGPRHWEDVDQAARAAMAGSRMDPWLTPLVALGVAAACAVTAWVRSDSTVALPAVPLMAWAITVFLVMRRAVRLAAWWLADPPAQASAGIGA